MIITLNTKVVNTSLQIGDDIYHTPLDSVNPSFASSEPIYVGTVVNMSGNKVEVQDPVLSTPANGDFLMFSKNKSANNTSLIGYYAEVTLMNKSIDKAELFSLSSEVVQSSK